MAIRKRYGKDRVRVPSKNRGVSLTKQAMKKDCDINEILRKYNKTGVITHLANSEGQYGDFSEVTGYQDAMQAVLDAKDMFMELPSYLRKRFGNNPESLLAFLNDSDNLDEAIELGLVERPQEYVKPSDTDVDKAIDKANADAKAANPEIQE